MAVGGAVEDARCCWAGSVLIGVPLLAVFASETARSVGCFAGCFELYERQRYRYNERCGNEILTYAGSDLEAPSGFSSVNWTSYIFHHQYSMSDI